MILFSNKFGQIVEDLILTVDGSAAELTVDLSQVVFLLGQGIFVGDHILCRLLETGTSAFLVVEYDSGHGEVEMVVADGCHQLVLGLRAVERDERLIEDKPFVHNTGDDLLVLVVSVHQGDAAVDVLLILDELAHILETML